MKKHIILIAMLIAHMFALPLFAQTDLTYRDVFRDFIEKRDLSYVNQKFSIGDTLHISSSYCQAAYVMPDTIWKKRVKKPKEGKHYILQYIWNGAPTTEKTKSDFPIYEQSTYKIDGTYIYSINRFAAIC